MRSWKDEWEQKGKNRDYNKTVTIIPDGYLLLVFKIPTRVYNLLSCIHSKPFTVNNLKELFFICCSWTN